MEGIIARLRQELEEAQDRWYSRGTRAGRDWVEHEAPYALLRQLGEAPPDERLKALRRSPPDALKKLKKKLQAEPDFSPESLFEGFCQAVGLLWEVIAKNL